MNVLIYQGQLHMVRSRNAPSEATCDTSLKRLAAGEDGQERGKALSGKQALRQGGVLMWRRP